MQVIARRWCTQIRTKTPYLRCNALRSQTTANIVMHTRSSITATAIQAHQNHRVAIASDFRVDGAQSPEIPQKEEVLGSEIAARNRKSLVTFYRTFKWQCSIALSCLGNRCNFWGPRWASQSQIAEIAVILVRYPDLPLRVFWNSLFLTPCKEFLVF